MTYLYILVVFVSLLMDNSYSRIRNYVFVTFVGGGGKIKYSGVSSYISYPCQLLKTLIKTKNLVHKKNVGIAKEKQ